MNNIKSALIIAIIVITLVQAITIVLWLSLHQKNIRFKSLGEMQFLYDSENNRFKRVGWRNFRRDRPTKGFLRGFANYEWYNLSALLKHLSVANNVRLRETFLIKEAHTSIQTTNFVVENTMYSINIFPVNENNEMFFTISWNFNKNVDFPLKKYVFNNLKEYRNLAIIPLNFRNELGQNSILFKEEFIEKIKSKDSLFFYEDANLFYLIIACKKHKQLLRKIERFNKHNLDLFKINIHFTTNSNIYAKYYDITDYNNDINALLAVFKEDLFTDIFVDTKLQYSDLSNNKNLSELVEIFESKITGFNKKTTIGNLLQISPKAKNYKLQYLSKIWTNICQRVVLDLLSKSDYTHNYIVIDDYMINDELLNVESNYKYLILNISFNHNNQKIYKSNKYKGFVFCDYKEKYVDLFKHAKSKLVIVKEEYIHDLSPKKYATLLDISKLSQANDVSLIYEKIPTNLGEKLTNDLNIAYTLKQE
ncbi:Uncharacterised protein [Mycoplasmopsis californica]|uniref:Uncharacterized protein n=1 Tax=Mycoplasmopsis equigenitalium TaxID=114883 RepID=A0ABY5J0G8_9BACT|nr:hypothetical protein [Mycoplasmopsis equigenitalium]UUD36749.1 hypothetical protein NPA09_02495 [Mycoplasmopsis equigenitalium]VEU69957.1 Uncharacterised protein [Mycoplasmopsis californica]